MVKKKHREPPPESPAPQSAQEPAAEPPAVAKAAPEPEVPAAEGAAVVAQLGESHPEATGLVEPPEEATRRLRSQLDALNDRYLRLAAEFDNFRKRATRERNETWARAQADLARKILEGLDNLARVAALDPRATGVADVIDGVRLVERKLTSELEGAGLERLGVAGEAFDPHTHEAVGALPATQPDQAGTVGAVLQVGYRFGGSLLRPARVMVLMADHPTQAGDAPTDG